MAAQIRTFRWLMKRHRSALNHVFIIGLVLFLNGCTGLYFHEAGIPPEAAPQLALQQLADCEYWTGIVFNGSKIGFSHTTITPSPAMEGFYDIRSEMALRFRLLMYDKRIQMTSYDQVAGDLTLHRFTYEYQVDGSRFISTGRIADRQLIVEIKTQDQTDKKFIPLEQSLYPTSAIYFYPILHGLILDREYEYRVYDMQSQSINRAVQKVAAYEKSRLFEGPAYKIETALLGQKTDTWMDRMGRPLLEMSLNGAITSALESESTAKRYLAQAALNKDEAILDFVRVKMSGSIPHPRDTEYLEIVLFNLGPNLKVPTDHRQRCDPHSKGMLCRIDAKVPPASAPDPSMPADALSVYLLSNHVIPSDHEKIQGTARTIVSDGSGSNEGNAWEKVHRLISWMDEHIEQQPVDVFTALDVLQRKKAECQGHAFLYTALARSLGIPTRVVNGIMYSSTYKGFLYHSWAESWLDNHWIAVDPTFHQIPADGTHIKLVEGEDMVNLIPLVNLLGQLEVRVIASEP